MAGILDQEATLESPAANDITKPQPPGGSAGATPRLDIGSIDVTGMADEMRQPERYTPSEESLVSGQLGRLLSGDSPYLQRARSRAAEAANSRGLLNSTMAVQSGEAAAIDAAMPIAQADAGAFLGAQRENTATANQFARDLNDFGREGALLRGRGLLEQEAQTQELSQRDRAQAGTNALRSRELDIRQEEVRTQASRDMEQRRQNLTADIGRLRQSSADAIARLNADPNMDGPAKREAIQLIATQTSRDIEEMIRFSGVDLPAAWPEWINQLNLAPNWGAAQATPPPPSSAEPAPPPESMGGSSE